VNTSSGDSLGGVGTNSTKFRADDGKGFVVHAHPEVVAALDGRLHLRRYTAVRGRQHEGVQQQ